MGHVDHVRPEGDVRSCRGFCSVPGPLQSVQRAELWGVILALQSSVAVHLGVDNLGVVRHVGRLLMVVQVLLHLSLSRMVIFSCLLRECFTFGFWTRFGLLRLRVMLMRVWFSMVEFGRLTGWVMMLLRLLILVVGELVMLSLMLVVICPGSVVDGILSFLTFIGSSLPFLGLLSTMTSDGTAPDPLVLVLW